MKKVKFIAIALALVTVVAMFAGCVKQSDVDAVQAKLDAANAELTTAKSDLAAANEKIAEYEAPVVWTNASEGINTFPYAELKGDELMAAVNKYQGAYAIATTNPDGSPCLVHTIWGMQQYNGKYYLLFVLKEASQTRLNILANKEGTASFSVNVWDKDGNNLNAKDDNGKQKGYACTGARVNFVLCEDKDVIAAISANFSYEIQIMEAVSFRPLG